MNSISYSKLGFCVSFAFERLIMSASMSSFIGSADSLRTLEEMVKGKVRDERE